MALIPTDYLLRAVVFITAGVILGNIIAETGVLARLNRISRPIGRLCGLSEPCIISMLTMTVNATAGKSMLAGYVRDGKIDRVEVIPTLLIGTFPSVLGEALFRVQLPTAVVLLGPVVGVLHTLLNLFATALQASAAMLYSRLVLRGRQQILLPLTDRELPPVKLDRETIVTGLRHAWPTLVRVIPITVIATLVFSLLFAAGAMEIIGAAFDPVLQLLGLPGESSAAIIAQFIHFSAGYAAVASLMAEGVLVLKTALITLVIGTMIIITKIYLRYTGPLYLSLFGKDGPKVAAVTYLTSMAAKIVTILVILALF